MITAAQADYLKKCEEHDALTAEDRRLSAIFAQLQLQMPSSSKTLRAQLMAEMGKITSQRSALIPKLQRAVRERDAADMARWNEKRQANGATVAVPVALPSPPPLINDAQWQHIEQLARALRNEDLKALAKVKIATEFLNVALPILKKAREVKP